MRKHGGADMKKSVTNNRLSKRPPRKKPKKKLSKKQKWPVRADKIPLSGL